jgi:hypothetical protein
VRNGEILAPGPGHSATDRSLSVKPDEDAPDGFVVFSFAGDDPIACRDYVRDRLGLPKWKPNGAGTAKKATKATGTAAAAKPYSPTVATFVYRDQEGRPYLRVQRTADKQFFQSHWEDETWKPGAPKGPKLPYLLPALFAAAPNMPVYITEGEGKADLLAKLGFIATSASGGKAPRIMKVDGRQIISPEAERDWRLEREREAAAELAGHPSLESEDRSKESVESVLNPRTCAVPRSPRK